MKNKIDQYFKNKLNIPQQPPADAWEFIQSRIPKEEKKRFMPLWIKISGIAALFLFLVGGGYMLNLFESNSPQNSTEIQNQSTVSNGLSDSGNETENWNEENSSSEGQITEEENLYNYPIDGQNKTYSHQNSFNSNGNSQFISNLPNSSKYENNSTLNLSNNSFNLDNQNPLLDQTQIDNEVNSNTKQTDIVLNSFGNEKGNLYSPNKYSTENPFTDPLLDKLEKENKELIALNTKENKKKKSKSDYKKKPEFDRFYISGFVSPMALNTFVGNSMLADDMSQYKTENNVTLAYGIKGAYALSPRVKIRTGVSVVGFEQITQNVPLSASIENGSAFSMHDARNNIKYHGNLRIENHQATSLAESELNYKTLNGDIRQQSQYIEIPVEAEVSVFQTNSIGISATAGGSTWLLSKNKIFAHTEDYTEELGKAENLNNTSFSANAGLKFDMKISEKVNVNVEPAFKYLINPVNDIKKYNPYTVGVNAGVTVSLK